MEFRLPPVLKNTYGDIRTVGFELEFGEVDLDTAAACIVELFGGVVQRESNFLQKVKNTSIGDFRLKMDARMLSEKSYEDVLEKIGFDADSSAVENFVESLASLIVPYEIDTPPLPLTEIQQIERLRLALHEKKATGTKASLLTAYATHINPEIPQQDVENVLKYLRAFVLLYPWIFEEAEIAFTRRMSNYINPFPDEYVELILQPDYQPALEQFILDYHEHNPDRNRPLDLYPVLSCLNKEIIAALKDIGSVKSRPAFHYRLPNSLMDDPEWTLAKEWNRWVAVECLASDEQSIGKLSVEYLRLNENLRSGFRIIWIQKTQSWVKC